MYARPSEREKNINPDTRTQSADAEQVQPADVGVSMYTRRTEEGRSGKDKDRRGGRENADGKSKCE